VMRDVRATVESHATSHASAPPLELRWNDGSGGSTRFRSRSLKLAVSQPVLTDLRALLGNDRVRLVRGSAGTGAGVAAGSAA